MPEFIATLKGVDLSFVAIDEAHCISEWGHNFRPDYLKIARLAKQLEVERVLALTATATPQVADDVWAMKLRPGYNMEWGGVTEDEILSNEQLIPGIIPAVIIMLFIMVALSTPAMARRICCRSSAGSCAGGSNCRARLRQCSSPMRMRLTLSQPW